MKFGLHSFFLCVILSTVFIGHSRAHLNAIDGFRNHSESHTQEMVKKASLPLVKTEDDSETFDDFVRNLNSQVNEINRCATESPTGRERAQSDNVLRDYLRDTPNEDERRAKKIVIRTYWHRIKSDNDEDFKSTGTSTKGKGDTDAAIRALSLDRADGAIGAFTTEGTIKAKTVKKQMNVLNRAFKKSGFIFKLVTPEAPIENSEWFYGFVNGTGTNSTNTTGFDIRYKMKEDLHKGGCSELNIYTVAMGKDGLGEATYSFDCCHGLTKDGVLIDWETVPGGSNKPFNLGDTLVHQVGHWLGLSHTFEGGCENYGDYIKDTPAEASPATGCPKKRNSCPKKMGKDPVKNFMDYTDDKCANHFTKGQTQRMQSQWKYYRSCERHKTKKACTSDPSTCCKWSKRTCSGCT